MANLKIELVKSLNGRLEKHIATAESLGLRKIGQVTIQPDNTQTRGKIAKIGYLLEVTEVELTQNTFPLPSAVFHSVKLFFHSRGKFQILDIRKIALHPVGHRMAQIGDHQILAFLLSVFLCGFLYIGFDMIYSMALFGKVDLFIQHLGISSHYASLSRGVIDTRDVLYFISVIVLFLSMTKLVLSSRKW